MLYIIWMQCKCNKKSVCEGQRWCTKILIASKQANYMQKRGEVGKGRSGSCAGVGFIRFVMLWRKVTYST